MQSTFKFKSTQLMQPPSRSRYKMVQLLQNSLLYHFPVTEPFLLLQGNHLALQFLLVQAMAYYKFFISPKLELLLSLLLPPSENKQGKRYERLLLLLLYFYIPASSNIFPIVE